MSQRKNERVVCPECGMSLKTAFNFKVHCFNRHVPEELKCRPCRRQFTTKEETERHKENCWKTVRVVKKESCDNEAMPSSSTDWIADHPLMKIKSLDAPTLDPRKNKKTSNDKKRFLRPLIPAAPRRTLKMITRSQAKCEASNLNLSEFESSDSEDSSSDEDRHQLAAKHDDNDDGHSTDDEVSDVLLDDLKLSSDEESTYSDASEITGPSMSDDDDSDGTKTPQPFTDSLPAKGYFWVRKAPGPSVIEDFRSAPIADPEAVIVHFKRVCRDYSVEKASLLLLEKLKPLQAKKCVGVLEIFLEIFRKEFFGLKSNDSMGIFSRIVMTLVYHFYKKGIFGVAGQFLKFLKSKHIEFFLVHPIIKEDDVPVGLRVPKEAQWTIMCCSIYLELSDIESATNLLMRGLTEFVQESKIPVIEALKHLIHNIFHKMIESRSNGLLLKLFQHIYRVQVDTTYPIDLSVFYDGVISCLVTSYDVAERSQAIQLFEDIGRFSFMELNGIPARALLITAATDNIPRARLSKILMACVYKNAHPPYPPYDLEDSPLKFYSSMTKIEMQVYLEQFVFFHAMWQDCCHLEGGRSLIVEVIVTSNSARSYKYPVPNKMVNLDHSFEAARMRLTQALYHCLAVPSDVPVQTILRPYQGGKYILFEPIVTQLFRSVLKADQSECIFCRDCT